MGQARARVAGAGWAASCVPGQRGAPIRAVFPFFGTQEGAELL